jgi:hypothetical protein
MKDVEPLQPTEYILKAVVNAAYGQEQGSVGSIESTLDDEQCSSISSITSKRRNPIFSWSAVQQVNVVNELFVDVHR